MGWVRVDDSFYDHPKLIGLDACEIGLWVIMLAWSNRYMTDGHLPTAAVRRFQHDQEPALLVAAGLWKETETGFEIHDYLEYQPSAAQVNGRRERDRSRKNRDEVESAEAVSSSDAMPDGLLDDSEQIPRGIPPASEVPQAQSPDSLRSSSETETKKPSRRKQKTPVPDPFTISDDMADWANEKLPGFDWETESEVFLNYWRSKGTTHADWPATWKVWMQRNARGDFRPNQMRGLSR